ncbi:MAG: NapC/NirT family cytochrome c, partial [Planctomycetota bacterium]
MLTQKVLNLLRLSGLPRFWQVSIFCLVGIIAGMGLVIVRISNAASYLSDSPETCINCHVMTDAYASWQRGSHGRVAA